MAFWVDSDFLQINDGVGGGPKFVYPEFTARPLQTERFNKKLAKLAKKFSRTMIISRTEEKTKGGQLQKKF